MKITKKYLQELIKEETKNLLQEEPKGDAPDEIKNIPQQQLEKIYEKCVISSGDNQERQCGHFGKELERRMRIQMENKQITKKYLERSIREELEAAQSDVADDGQDIDQNARNQIWTAWHMWKQGRDPDNAIEGLFGALLSVYNLASEASQATGMSKTGAEQEESLPVAAAAAAPIQERLLKIIKEELENSSKEDPGEKAVKKIKARALSMGQTLKQMGMPIADISKLMKAAANNAVEILSRPGSKATVADALKSIALAERNAQWNFYGLNKKPKADAVNKLTPSQGPPDGNASGPIRQGEVIQRIEKMLAEDPSLADSLRSAPGRRALRVSLAKFYGQRAAANGGAGIIRISAAVHIIAAKVQKSLYVGDSHDKKAAETAKKPRRLPGD